MSKMPDEIISNQSERTRLEILVDESMFKRLLGAVSLVEEGHRDAFIKAITASCCNLCKFVGSVLGQLLGESKIETAPKKYSSTVLMAGGSSHELETALSPSTIAAGYIGKLVYPYEKPQYPVVNGKRTVEELTTDEERAEWRLQQAHFERQRAAEVRALKSLAFRYVLSAARAYLEAEAMGSDLAATLADYGVPNSAREVLEREVVSRLRRLPPEVLKSTLENL